MRHLAVILLATLASSTLAHDAKSECIKALNEAKMAGLPISPADMKVPKPSKETIALEKLIDMASKTMRKYEPDIGVIIDIDMANLKRKDKGQKELPYPEVTEAQKASRTKETVAIIERIGISTAPRQYNVRSTPLDSFPRSASVKAFVKMELEDVAKFAKKGETKDVVRKLKIVRRLVQIVRSDATVVGLLGEQAAEQQFYAALQKISKDHPSISKSFTLDFVAPFHKPSIEQILRDEFIHELSLFESSSKAAKKHPTIDIGDWKLEASKESLEYLTAITRAWTTSFIELRSCKSGKELEDRYKVLAPKLGTLKLKDQDPMLLGPSWADNAKALDKAETKRLETIKVLGLG